MASSPLYVFPMPSNEINEVFITASEVARLIGVTKHTLARWAREGRGPQRYNFGPGAARYRVEDIHAWIESSRR